MVARVMVKYGTNSSQEVGPGKFKGGSGVFRCWNEEVARTTSPMWALDVDHGEDWAGTPYMYTGYYNRYASKANSGPYWPYFT